MSEVSKKIFTDTFLKKIKSSGKRERKPDPACRGLYFEIKASGDKRWVFRYKVNNKTHWMPIGEYPNLSLSNARAKALELHNQRQIGIDPLAEIEKQKQEAEQQAQELETRLTFNQLFEKWFETSIATLDHEYAKDIRERVTNHLLPKIGRLFVEDIKPKHIINVLKDIESTGKLETMRRIKQYARRVFSYGVGYGYCEHNPVTVLPNDIFTTPKAKNFAHTTDPKLLAKILRSIDQYTGDISTCKALELQPFVFLRSKELASIRWCDIDEDNEFIEIPSETMKKDRAHLIPITPQIQKIIEFMRPYSGQYPYLFPSPRSMHQPINRQSLTKALNRMGFQHIQSFHGFRHTASTMLHEMGFHSDIIEKQLSHEQQGVRAFYNKAEYWKPRVEMMKSWSKYLVSLKHGDNIVPFQHGATANR